MKIDDVLAYMAESPQNTNPNIVKGMLKELTADSEIRRIDLPPIVTIVDREVTFDEYGTAPLTEEEVKKFNYMGKYLGDNAFLQLKITQNGEVGKTISVNKDDLTIVNGEPNSSSYITITKYTHSIIHPIYCEFIVGTNYLKAFVTLDKLKEWYKTEDTVLGYSNNFNCLDGTSYALRQLRGEEDRTTIVYVNEELIKLLPLVTTDEDGYLIIPMSDDNDEPADDNTND